MPSPLGKVAKIGSSEPIFDGRGTKSQQTSPAPFGGALPKGEGVDSPIYFNLYAAAKKRLCPS